MAGDGIVLVSHRCERIGAPAKDGHGATGFGQNQGSGSPNAGASAGNDNMAVGKAHDGLPVFVAMAVCDGGAVWASRSASRHRWSLPAS